MTDRTHESAGSAQRECVAPLAANLRSAIVQLALLFASLALWEIFCQTPLMGKLGHWPRTLIASAGHFVIVSASAMICVRFVSLLQKQIVWNRDLNKRLADEQTQARKLALVASRTSNGVIVTDADGAIEWVNDGFTRITGFSMPDVIGKTPGSFLYAPETDPLTKDYINSRMASAQGVHTELVIQSKTGRRRWIVLEIQPIFDASRKLTNFVALQSDITASKQAESDLRRSNAFLDSIIDNIPHLVFVKDLRDQQFVLFNRAGEELLGMTRAQAQAKTTSDTLPSDLASVFLTNDDDAMIHPDLIDIRERPVATPHRGPRMLEIKRVAIPDADNAPRYLLGIAQDVTDRNVAAERLRHAASHDPLTQLPNRTYFFDRLAQCIQRQRHDRNYEFAVLYMDLDHFKLINDSLGHSVGDLLLLDTARKIVAAVGECAPHSNTARNCVVARLGGDEFTVLLDSSGCGECATKVAERISRSLREPFNFPGREVFITASIGITTSEIGYEHPEEVLRDADTAMYRAKSCGRARYQLFDRSMHEQALVRLDTENDLRRALDHNELELHYQPILSLSDRRLLGVEALLRWKHPTRGYISPAEFVPVAEETGIIIPVGSWVIREACRQFADWRRRFPSMPTFAMSINLSRKQFIDNDLVPLLDRMIKEHALDPSLICLEITESMIMENADVSTPVLQEIRRRKINLHMDDFGTGYSSLSCLHRFPINALKIDRAFIANLGGNEDYAAVVQAIVSLAHNLHSQVIAEGVETPEQVAMLQSLNCDAAQGFYFAKPLTPSELESTFNQPGMAIAA